MIRLQEAQESQQSIMRLHAERVTLDEKMSKAQVKELRKNQPELLIEPIQFMSGQDNEGNADLDDDNEPAYIVVS